MKRNGFVKTGLLLMVWTLYTGNLYAQGDTVLRILVLNGEDGTPLTGATVLLGEGESDKTPEYFCVSDRDGLCEIRNIPQEREFQLQVRFVGFGTYTETIRLVRSERRILRAVLTPKIGEFEEVSVIQQRYLTTGEVGVQRISSAEISRTPSPVAGGDLATFLQTVPGLVTSGDRGGDLYIRGGTPDQNLILVDNMPIVKPFHISNLFSAFPDDIVQNADLYAGGFEPGYAGATSAVLDVRLRPGNMRRQQISAASSPYLLALQAEGPFQSNRSSYLINGRYSVIDRMAPYLTGKDLPIRFGDVTGRYTFQADNINCNITGIYTYDRGEIVPSRNLEHKWSNAGIGARCLGYSEFFNYPVDVSAGYTSYVNSEGTADQRERHSMVRQIYLKTAMQYQFAGMPVDMGFGVNMKSYLVELSERFTQFLSLENISRAIPVVHIYTATEWSPVQTLTVYPGFASQFTLDMPVTFEPRIRIAFQPRETGRSQFSIAAGKYVQTHSGISDERDAGTVFTVYQPVEFGDPLPSSLHGLAGYEQQFGENIFTILEAYVKRHSNIPVSKWNPEPRIEIETALADGLTYGFDVRVSVESQSRYVSASYGWSTTEYEAISGDLGAWVLEPVFNYSPAHDQRHKLNISGGYTIYGYQIDARWELGSGMPYTQIFGYDFAVRVPRENPNTDPGTARILFSEPYGERMPWYHRLDVSIGKNFRIGNRSTLVMQAGVINAYNRRNVFNFDYGTLERVDQTPLLPYISFKIDI